MGLCTSQWAITGVKSFGSFRRSLSCKRMGRSGGSFCWRVNGGLGIVCIEMFCVMMCSVEVWTFLSAWVGVIGESGMVTTDCSGELERVHNILGVGGRHQNGEWMVNFWKARWLGLASCSEGSEEFGSPLIFLKEFRGVSEISLILPWVFISCIASPPN